MPLCHPTSRQERVLVTELLTSCQQVLMPCEQQATQLQSPMQYLWVNFSVDSTRRNLDAKVLVWLAIWEVHVNTNREVRKSCREAMPAHEGIAVNHLSYEGWRLISRTVDNGIKHLLQKYWSQEGIALPHPYTRSWEFLVTHAVEGGTFSALPVPMQASSQLPVILV